MIVPDRLIDAIVLEDMDTAIGRVFVQGVGFRVGSLNMHGEIHHMGPAEARRFARDLASGPHSDELTPVIEALQTMADRVESPGDLASMPVKGRA